METTKAKVETYLSVLEPYSDAQIEAACQAFMRRNNPFPPSAGELAHECKAAVVYTPDPERLKRLRGSGEPSDTRSAEEKAASRQRVAAMYAAWRAGVEPTGRRAAVGDAETGHCPSSGPIKIGEGLQEFLVGMMGKEPPPVGPVEVVAPSARVIEVDDDAPLF